MLNAISSDLKLSDFISGEINFSGSKDNLLIDEASLNTNLFNLNAKIDIEDIFSSNFNAKIDLNEINFNEENINSKYDIDDRVYYPSMKGDLTLVDNKIRYNLNQIEKSKTEVEIEGTAIFENDLIYNLALNINVNSEDQILDFLNLKPVTCVL